MTLGEFIKTQKGVSSFGLYIADRKNDNIVETQLSLATALDWQTEEVAYVNYCIVENKQSYKEIRACIYVKLCIDNR